MKTLLTITTLVLISACTTQEVGQAMYDSAKNEECRKQGINHCDPYNQGKLKNGDEHIAGSNSHSNEALEQQAEKIRDSQ